MVIRGNSRGNARQLSQYLLTKKDNERIRILDVDGREDAQAEDLHRTVFTMGLSAELSKSDKGIYHAQINPAIGEDASMDDAAWMKAGDILGRQLGLENQRRAIVLHTKKGRTHAHVVWERYDHEKEKMVSDSFSRLAQDRARKEMELVFSHKPTPHRNKHRPELKENLSRLWQQSDTGAGFVKDCHDEGYFIATGAGRSPFVVVDERGHSFDLARQLKGIKLREVRERLRREDLMDEKAAIIAARKAASDASRDGRSTDDAGKQKATFTNTQNPSKVSVNFVFYDRKQQGQNAEAAKDAFHVNKQEATKQQSPDAAKEAAKNFAAEKEAITGQQRQQTIKEQFAENKEMTDPAKGETTDTRREAFRKRMREFDEEQTRNRAKGLDLER